MSSRRRRTSDDDAKPAKLNKATLRKFMRLFRYLREHAGIFAFGMLLLLIGSALSMVFPALMGRLVDATRGAAPTDAGELFDLNNIDSVALLLLGVFALQAIIGFFRIYIFSYVT
jgi:ABC-type multidrug transport system fused ATPase/permease subunit